MQNKNAIHCDKIQSQLFLLFRFAESVVYLFLAFKTCSNSFFDTEMLLSSSL